MRVIILGEPQTSVPDSAVEQAFALVAAVGCCEARALITDGIGRAPAGRDDIVEGWVALAQGFDLVMSATRH
jgi:hypothetical protein